MQYGVVSKCIVLHRFQLCVSNAPVPYQEQKQQRKKANNPAHNEPSTVGHCNISTQDLQAVAYSVRNDTSGASRCFGSVVSGLWDSRLVAEVVGASQVKESSNKSMHGTALHTGVLVAAGC